MQLDVLAADEYLDWLNFFVAAVNPPRNIWPPQHLISHSIFRQNTVHLTLDSPYGQLWMLTKWLE